MSSPRTAVARTALVGALLASCALALVTVVTPSERDARDLLRLADTSKPATLTDDLPLAHLWDVLPVFVARLPPGTPASWDDGHFSFTAKTRLEGSDLHIDLSLKKKTGGISEYLFMTAGGAHAHTFMLSGSHTLHFKGLSALELEDAQMSGIRVYRFPHGLKDSIKSLVQLLWFFVGVAETKIVTPYTTEMSLEFMKEYLNFAVVKRNNTGRTLTSNDVAVGDVIAIMRLDGLDPCVMWVTGGRVAHMAIVWEIDGIKQICESQSAMYWPIDGIQCNPFDEWVTYAEKAEYNAVVLPLDPKIRSILNVSLGAEYFANHKGEPYGFQSFLPAGIDTIHDNLPEPILNQHILELFGDLISVLSPSSGSQILFQALSHRTGLPDNSTWPEVLVASERKYGSVMEAMVEPELDETTFDGMIVRVCSSFAVDILQHAGAFPGVKLNAVEFTPHDVTDLAIFDRSFTAPSACREADPELAAAGYCQLMGQYRVNLGPTFNTWKVHDHMGERCASNFRSSEC